MEYTLIYADRRSISVSVKDGQVNVKAPRKTPKAVIDNFVNKHARWIEKQILRCENERLTFGILSHDDIIDIKKNARTYFKDKTEYYSKIMN